MNQLLAIAIRKEKCMSFMMTNPAIERDLLFLLGMRENQKSSNCCPGALASCGFFP